MTTMTMNPTRPGPRPDFARLVHSESIKLATLRSPWWSAVLVVVISVGLSAAMAAAYAAMPDEAYSGDVDGLMAVRVVLMPTTFTVLLATIVGALQSAGEYSTGMILASTTAAPKRLGSVGAKAIVVGAFVFVVSVVTFVISSVVTAPILAQKDIRMDWSVPSESWGSLLIGAASMAVFAVIGLSCGYLLRSPAAALSVSIAIVFLLPLIPGFIPPGIAPEWLVEIARMLPTNAFQTLVIGEEKYRLAASLALIGWTILPLLAAMATVKRRDA